MAEQIIKVANDSHLAYVKPGKFASHLCRKTHNPARLLVDELSFGRKVETAAWLYILTTGITAPEQVLSASTAMFAFWHISRVSKFQPSFSLVKYVA